MTHSFPQLRCIAWANLVQCLSQSLSALADCLGASCIDSPSQSSCALADRLGANFVKCFFPIGSQTRIIFLKALVPWLTAWEPSTNNLLITAQMPWLSAWEPTVLSGSAFLKTLQDLIDYPYLERQNLPLQPS